ncbi:hypothetical protein [Nonomuraea sp. NPDC049028]|uniref:hypothetical protein n=1 Tax=Nonomuraea sp. NPDC049028 TaxID=3364348 RepID=UPI0037198F69
MNKVEIASSFGAFVFGLLMVILLIVGIVLMIRARAEHGRAAMLGMYGCIALLIGVVFDVARGLTLPYLIDAFAMRSIGVVVLVEGLVSLILNGGGVGLLIWAVVARRTPAQPQQTPGWQQPQQPQGWQQPQQSEWQRQSQSPPEWQPQSPPQPPSAPQPGWQDPERPGWQNPQG